MGRRGWQAIEVPHGWFNVIRGPRPPSVRWPQAQSSHQPEKVVRSVPVAAPAKGGDRSNQGRWRQGRPKISPDVALENDRKRVAGLEAAITAMIANGNNIVRISVKTSQAEGRRRFHRNTAHARLSGFNSVSRGASLAFGCRRCSTEKAGVLVFFSQKHKESQTQSRSRGLEKRSHAAAPQNLRAASDGTP